MTTIVDKATTRDWLKAQGCEKYCIPLYGIYNNIQEIDRDTLPEKFVIKANTGGGSNWVHVCRCFCDDEWDKIVKKLGNIPSPTRATKIAREWAYTGIKQSKIIVEELLEDASSAESDLTDYKFFCFNGNVPYCQAITNRSVREYIDYYDRQWNRLEGVRGLNVVPSNSPIPLKCPNNYAEMISLAEKLSTGFPFVRVDLYNLNGRIYVGELTFYPASGYGSFTPDSFDFELGNLFDISCFINNKKHTYQC